MGQAQSIVVIVTSAELAEAHKRLPPMHLPPAFYCITWHLFSVSVTSPPQSNLGTVYRSHTTTPQSPHWLQ